LEIDFPVVQAALSGYSDAAMRTIARRLGAPYTVAEVVLDEFLLNVRQARVRRRWMSVSPEQHPVGGQLMGADPARFAPAARRLVEAGFDVIDINFGCPVRKVLGRCRGGFHLGQPKIALEIVAHVRDAVPHAIPVTVKMRRGLDDGEASREKFFTILDGAFARGVAAVTVHGRTVAQRYDGPSEWDFLRRVKQHVGTRTVLGSGDLFTAQDCLDMLRYTGVDGCTVARGAIGNPWIFSQVRALASGNPLPTAPSLWKQREVIAAHYTLAEQLYGADRCLPPMRKFGIKYAQLHPDAVAVRDAFVRVRQAGEWRDVLRTWYAEDRPGRTPVPDAVNPRSSSAVANQATGEATPQTDRASSQNVTHVP
ncbi:MAG: tRNA dihydrouridine synthase, partial [Pirellulales bacterium]